MIISDISGPVPTGPSCICYQEEFYKLIESRLTNNGIFAAQISNAGYIQRRTSGCLLVHNTISSVFKNASLYWQHTNSKFEF